MSDHPRSTEPTDAELGDPLLAACTVAAVRWGTRPELSPGERRDYAWLYERNAAIQAAANAGRSWRAIARATGMTHRGVKIVYTLGPWSREDWEESRERELELVGGY